MQASPSSHVISWGFTNTDSIGADEINTDIDTTPNKLKLGSFVGRVRPVPSLQDREPEPRHYKNTKSRKPRCGSQVLTSPKSELGARFPIGRSVTGANGREPPQEAHNAFGCPPATRCWDFHPDPASVQLHEFQSTCCGSTIGTHPLNAQVTTSVSLAQIPPTQPRETGADRCPQVRTTSDCQRRGNACIGLPHNAVR